MIPIPVQLNITELNELIKSLQSRKQKKQKRIQTWVNRKANNLLEIPEHVADLFIQLDTGSIDIQTPLIHRLEKARDEYKKIINLDT